MVAQWESKYRKPRVDPSVLTRLQLPAHVQVWAGGRWRRGWLIARAHEDDGWAGLVQYDTDDGVEMTEWIPADRVAAADTWLADRT